MSKYATLKGESGKFIIFIVIDMAEWVIISLSLDQCITQNKFGAILRKMLFLWSDAKGIHFGAAFETLNIWSWWNILLYMMINLTFSSAILNDNLYICRKLKICKKFHKISRQIISFQDVSGFFFSFFYFEDFQDLYNPWYGFVQQYKIIFDK